MWWWWLWMLILTHTNIVMKQTACTISFECTFFYICLNMKICVQKSTMHIRYTQQIANCTFVHTYIHTHRGHTQRYNCYKTLRAVYFWIPTIDMSLWYRPIPSESPSYGAIVYIYIWKHVSQILFTENCHPLLCSTRKGKKEEENNHNTRRNFNVKCNYKINMSSKWCTKTVIYYAHINVLLLTTSPSTTTHHTPTHITLFPKISNHSRTTKKTSFSFTNFTFYILWIHWRRE